MLIHLIVLFVIIIDPIGNVPFFVGILRPFEPKRQRTIIIRELIIALIVMIFFLYFGNLFFEMLNVGDHALEITGGLILFLIALGMLFAKHELEGEVTRKVSEPMIVPLAVPAVAGPAILAAIILYGGGEVSKFIVLLAILIAWAISAVTLLLAPHIKKWIGGNGAIAVERIFGYLVVVISVEMIVSGIKTFFS